MSKDNIELIQKKQNRHLGNEDVIFIVPENSKLSNSKGNLPFTAHIGLIDKPNTHIIV